MKKTDKILPNRLLRNQRKLHCWTQSQVAEKLGTTTVNVNRWESGLTFPSLYFRQRLCELFGKSAEELGHIPETERQERAIALASPSLPPLWNVPFRRNPFFTGREEVLVRLREALTGGRIAAVTQPQAISGLGGVGKTQTAVEYAYRYQSHYQAVLWVKADSRELLIADIVNLARLLNLAEQDEQDQNRAVAAVKR
jgi:transcriptional regulator with XRE-family HTH domain